MSKEAVETEILEPMQRLFLAPRQMDNAQQARALRDYVEALKGFGADVLSEAWQTIRNSHTGRTWPAIGVFVKAAIEAHRLRDPLVLSKLTGPRHRFDMDGWNAHFRKNWEYIRTTPLALGAARDGWALVLKTAVMAGLPLGAIKPMVMIAKVERAGRLNDKIEADLAFPNRETCLKLYRGVLIDRAKVEHEIQQHYGKPASMPAIQAFEFPYRVTVLDDPPEAQLQRAYG